MVSILGRGVASANFQVEGNLQVPIEVLIAELITGGRIGEDLKNTNRNLCLMVLMMAFVMRSISPPLLRLGPVITPVPSTASLILSCYSVGMLSCRSVRVYPEP